jgi:hypothetical protein
MKIVETDNSGGDYPDEKFVNLPHLNEDQAEKICAVINSWLSGESAPRYWVVVSDDYKLVGGFKP